MSNEQFVLEFVVAARAAMKTSEVLEAVVDKMLSARGELPLSEYQKLAGDVKAALNVEDGAFRTAWSRAKGPMLKQGAATSAIARKAARVGRAKAVQAAAEATDKAKRTETSILNLTEGENAVLTAYRMRDVLALEAIVKAMRAENKTKRAA